MSLSPVASTLMASGNVPNVNNTATTNLLNYEYTTTNIPAFLNKLWTLVEDVKFNDLIAWDQSGFSFHVFDQARFAREILPRFFKHNNMASFIRQLNMYGFRKVNNIDHGSCLRNENEDVEFHHPYFIKGKEHFLEFIKRKVSNHNSNSNNQVAVTTPAPTASILQSSPQQQIKSNQQQPQQQSRTSPTSSSSSAIKAPSPPPPLSPSLPIKSEDFNKVLDDVNTIRSRQKKVDDSLINVKRENEALWKEIAMLRQKHHHQQQIVNKLIHFLVHLVNPSSMNMNRSGVTRPLMIDSHSSFINPSNNLEDDEENDNNNIILDSNMHHINSNSNSPSNDDHSRSSGVKRNNTNNLTSSSSSSKEATTSNRANNSINNFHNQYINANEIYELSNNDQPSNKKAKTVNLALRNTINNNNNNNSNTNFMNTDNNNKTSFVPSITYSNNTANYNTNGNINSLNKGIIINEIPFVPSNKNNNLGILSNNNVQSPMIESPLTDYQEDSSPRKSSYSHQHGGQHSHSLQIHPINNHNQMQQQHHSLNFNNENDIASSSNNTNSSDDNNTHQEIIDFLNMNSSAAKQINNNDNRSTSPIVTSPMSNQYLTVESDFIRTPNDSNTNLIQLTPNNEMIRTNNTNNNNNTTTNILKRAMSNQIHDETNNIQIDLNSIKEFLTNNNFSHQFDPLTINSLFSPALDQFDPDSYYLESSIPLELSTSGNNEDQSPMDSANNRNNNGRIVGNELIQQYRPPPPPLLTPSTSQLESLFSLDSDNNIIISPNDSNTNNTNASDPNLISNYSDLLQIADNQDNQMKKMSPNLSESSSVNDLQWKLIQESLNNNNNS